MSNVLGHSAHFDDTIFETFKQETRLAVVFKRRRKEDPNARIAFAELKISRQADR